MQNAKFVLGARRPGREYSKLQAGNSNSWRKTMSGIGMGPVPREKAVPLLVLDMDGTVRQGKDDALGRFVNGPDDVVVFPEAVIQMRKWKDKGGRISCEPCNAGKGAMVL
jgi:hypothetical protein